ncbi:putative clathrin light chain protein [Phaeoacremonium minimum UCRPA7]|uniref:Clathrin light chain n=1 Tax=Phaeoacremonium minimum (strain UCR-PA7) TaxID=1286976 RepID=R8BA06_PHAM7|nr:putative clathrin light chain protein [Phaeoacremonium minimum UCRPA7]EON96133.1 putative clathrin light chain protein [Phaeoacremonium minimum UCRPA7]
MADRFPSLEDFDSGAQTDIKDPSAEPSADDFLAREKAILGDDADQFATNQDAAALSGGDDLLGGGDDAQFQSQFPDITSPNEGLAGSGTITGPSVSYNSGYAAAYTEEEDEPEVIKEWREKRDAGNAKRAEQFAQQREETVKEAQQNIDDFYDNYNNKKEKMINQTRKEAEQFLASREDTTSGGTSWERISKIVDVSGKGAKGGAAGSGKERFRELLTSLRKDEKAPGAEGY